MLKKILICTWRSVVFLLLINLPSQAQKLPIDSSCYKNWEFVKDPIISNDGNYASYKIQNRPEHSFTLYLVSTNAKWRKGFIGFPEVVFANNSKVAILKKSDSISLVNLRTHEVNSITNVNSFKISNANKAGDEWLGIQFSTLDKKLIVRNLTSGEETSFFGVQDYEFCRETSKLIIQTKLVSNPRSQISVQIVDLTNSTNSRIWQGDSIKNMVFNKDGDQLAFITPKAFSAKGDSIWYYKSGFLKAKLLSVVTPGVLPDDLHLERLSQFSNDNARLFLYLTEKALANPNADAVQLNIWSYRDSILQSSQLLSMSPNSYLACIQINDSKIVRIQNNGEQVYLSDNSVNDNWLVGSKREYISGRLLPKIEYSLISTKNGDRKDFPYSIRLSPGGKFLVYFDSEAKNFFSYEISTHITRIITASMPITWFEDVYDRWPGKGISNISIAGWVEKDQSLILSDKYDIWKVDLLAQSEPICLTRGLGLKNKIVFRLMSQNNNQVYNSDDNLYLSAFDTQCKDNGFYKASLSDPRLTEPISMVPYSYYIPMDTEGDPSGHLPVKAKDADRYLVLRSSAKESENIFYTRNFKDFSRLSDVKPEENYNWLSTELLTWKTSDKYSQGVLYKPENFDKKKKYPIIFYYYEKLSDRLNVFNKPEPSDGRLNISWYVSNGYLVFTPDIYYKKGEPGQSALDYVVSAAKFLSTFDFVDAKKMGIQGISHGGFETNYIVTHTGLFAAACSAAAATNLTAKYGSLEDNAEISHSYYETGQARIGYTLWEKPELYINNSPIFQADKVTTPLLLFHTTIDGAVPFEQAIEFFSGLRRLGKRVWLLEYNEGNHGVWGASAMDFDLRMQQFFNYYLKDSPPPKWMTEGRPAKLKGIDDKLKLDYSGTKP